MTRHGCEPWTDLAVKLLLKWPNLYYSTTAFAPKYYPKEIIDFANTRGADKVIFSGYFPAGPHLRPDLHRDARRAVPRPRVAEVPARERAAGVQAAANRMSTGPLAGIRVIELPNIGPVQFAGMLLADMGAEVLRLDRATDVATGSNVPASCRRTP